MIAQRKQLSDFVGMTPDRCGTCKAELQSGVRLWVVVVDPTDEGTYSEDGYCSAECATKADDNNSGEDE